MGKKIDSGDRSDAALAWAAQGGEKRAFVEIVARHQAMVTGVALAILRDFAASEDAAQEAFLTAWKKLGTLREPAKLRPWLARIARTSALMHLRRKGPESPLDDTTKEGETTFGPDEAVASREESALVLAALDELPENYRLPLVLFYREEQSVRAVAETLELSEDAVKQRLSRGREMLRARVAGVVDSVLGRTIPTTIFTMTIAAAIGALAAPSAVAASVFSGAAVATGTTAVGGGSAGVTSSSAATGVTAVAATTVTTMSTSKLTLAAAAIAAVCIPVGYTARLSTEPGDGSAVVSPRAELTVDGEGGEESAPPELPDTVLVAEWKRLLAEHGRGPEDLPRLHAVLEKFDDPFRKRAFLSALIAEWARVDGPGALAFFREHQGRDLRWQKDLLLEEWIKRDPEGAIEGMMASGEGWESLVRGQLVRIARRAPGRVPGLIAQLPEAEGDWDKRVRDAYEIVARSDLGGSRAAAEALSGPNRSQALSGVAMVWAERDGAAALGWAQELASDERFEVMRSVLVGWARTDARAALDRIELVPVGGDGMYFGSGTGAKVLREAAKADFEATLDWLRENGNKLGREELIGLSEAVKSRLVADPAGFLGRHEAEGTLPPLMSAISSALLNDASSVRLEIWEWLKSAPSTEMTKRLRSHVLGGLGWQQPRTAMRLVDEMPTGDERAREMELTANRIVNGGSNVGVLDGLLDEATPEWRKVLIQSGLTFLRPEYFQNPEKWIGRLAEVEEPVRSGMVANLARAWAQDQPESSAAWVASLENSGERRAGLGAVATEWSRTDPHGAGEWVVGLPEGTERDAAAGGLATGLVEEDPREAWGWVESIGDDARRFETGRRILETMAGRDREGALQLLEVSSFSPEEKGRLREVLVERGSTSNFGGPR